MTPSNRLFNRARAYWRWGTDGQCWGRCVMSARQTADPRYESELEVSTA